MMTVWDLEENDRPIFSFRPSLGKLRNVSVSADAQMLTMSGKDFQGRELILVYSY
jgi:WD40 repeat protein